MPCVGRARGGTGGMRGNNVRLMITGASHVHAGGTASSRSTRGASARSRQRGSLRARWRPTTWTGRTCDWQKGGLSCADSCTAGILLWLAVVQWGILAVGWHRRVAAVGPGCRRNHAQSAVCSPAECPGYLSKFGNQLENRKSSWFLHDKRKLCCVHAI